MSDRTTARGEKPFPLSDELLSFVVETSNEHVLVFDADQTLVFRNDKARKFLDRHALPEEFRSLVGKILSAIALEKSALQFPGQICFHREIGERNWLFRVAFREGHRPLVGIFFTDETVSGRFDLNALRSRHRLTRRETDVLRHLLDGLKNLDIAEELAITEQTVKDYLSSIYQKFGVPDRFALLRVLICISPE